MALLDPVDEAGHLPYEAGAIAAGHASEKQSPLIDSEQPQEPLRPSMLLIHETGFHVEVTVARLASQEDHSTGSQFEGLQYEALMYP